MHREVNPFEIVYLDVGQGDCTIFNLPDGSIGLIDLGPLNSPVIEWLQRDEQMRRRIHFIVITHNDADHAGSLNSLLDLRQDIQTLYLLTHVKQGKRFNDAFALAARLHRAGRLKLVRLEVGVPPIYTDSDTVLSVVFPDFPQNAQASSPNATSGILTLSVKGTILAIWPGDSKLSSIANYAAPSKPFVLMGPHHGGPTDWHINNSPSIISTFQPQRAYISVGTHNSHRHPYPEYLSCLKSLGCRPICSQLTVCCDKRAKEEGRNVLKGSAKLGYPTAVGTSCRGSMKLTLRNRILEVDRFDVEHLSKVSANVRKPRCVS